jgi:two-component system cell cycle sensor histidine kinase PleC
LVIAILLVAMWAMVGLSVVNSRQAALDATRSESRNLMIAFREEVALILRGVDVEMSLLADKMRSEGNNFDLYAWGRATMLVSPGMAYATIINPDGMMRASTLDPRPPPTDLSDRGHYLVHLDGQFRGLYVGKTVTGRLSGASVVPISRRVEAEDGTFLGVIVILISPNVLTTLHKSIDLGAHGVMTLAGLDHVIRARFASDSPDGTVGVGSSLAGGSERPDVIEEYAEGSFMRAGKVDGITRLFAYGRVHNYPLVVTVGEDLDQELAPSHASAATIIYLGLGATLLLIVLATYLIHEIRVRASNEVELAQERVRLLEERTKLQATNVALGESAEQAQAASRAKSQFLANMSHELRMPLNAIIGFSEMLTAGFPGQLNPKQHGYVANIHEGGGFLLRVINDVLDLAQVDAGKLQLHEEEDVNLGGIAASRFALVEQQAFVGGLRLSLEIADPLPPVIVDPTRLTQILLNLLSNAVKFTEPDGSVSLGIRRAGNGGVVLEVRDTGPGMTAAEIEVALQPFGQVDGGLARRHNGTGLGLPLARELAELHGGSLTVESEKGRGTRIVVTLPPARVLANAVAASAVVGEAA